MSQSLRPWIFNSLVEQADSCSDDLVKPNASTSTKQRKPSRHPRSDPSFLQDLPFSTGGRVQVIRFLTFRPVDQPESSQEIWAQVGDQTHFIAVKFIGKEVTRFTMNQNQTPLTAFRGSIFSLKSVKPIVTRIPTQVSSSPWDPNNLWLALEVHSFDLVGSINESLFWPNVKYVLDCSAIMQRKDGIQDWRKLRDWFEDCKRMVESMEYKQALKAKKLTTTRRKTPALEEIPSPFKMAPTPAQKERRRGGERSRTSYETEDSSSDSCSIDAVLVAKDVPVTQAKARGERRTHQGRWRESAERGSSDWGDFVLDLDVPDPVPSHPDRHRRKRRKRRDPENANDDSIPFRVVNGTSPVKEDSRSYAKQSSGKIPSSLLSSLDMGLPSASERSRIEIESDGDNDSESRFPFDLGGLADDYDGGVREMHQGRDFARRNGVGNGGEALADPSDHRLWSMTWSEEAEDSFEVGENDKNDPYESGLSDYERSKRLEAKMKTHLREEDGGRVELAGGEISKRNHTDDGNAGESVEAGSRRDEEGVVKASGSRGREVDLDDAGRDAIESIEDSLAKGEAGDPIREPTSTERKGERELDVNAFKSRSESQDRELGLPFLVKAQSQVSTTIQGKEARTKEKMAAKARLKQLMAAIVDD
ncbi:hypothetical protein IE53DRAFT_407994 [Violaceomyces palustris]|uniref:Uncharacterized protein n=1 Tax=Violaceomyces palustris TaxID=1673888 RepID=A0ACD0P870_9BASI|nr:hypothetical protein IE53DRAFT_407994 [Violaceomyces palustris]